MFFRRGFVLASAATGITAATVALTGEKPRFPVFVRAESAKPTRTFADPHGFQGLIALCHFSVGNIWLVLKSFIVIDY